MIDVSESAYSTDYQENTRDLSVTDNVESLRITPSINSGETLYAVMTNSRSDTITYALSSFLDWKQNKWIDGALVKYIELPPQSTKIYEFPAPVVNKNTPLHVFVTPYGFSEEGIINLIPSSRNVEAGLRVIITPSYANQQKGDAK